MSALRIEAHHMNLPCEGFANSGDAVVVRQNDGTALLALIDALGHGPTAAGIAATAAAHLAEVPLDEGLHDTMTSLHRALEGTRGAAAMLVLLRDGSITGCGVGNVELRSLGANVPVVQSPGILGVRVRRYHVFSSQVGPGTRLVLFSDGISSLAPIRDIAQMDRREACEYIFRGYRRPHDDASVLVVDVHV